MSIKAQLKRIPALVAVNASIKARLQERAAARTLAACRTRLVREGIIVPEGPELQKRISALGIERRGGREPKQKGALHIFLPYGMANGCETDVAESLKMFGRVSEFDWRSLGFDDKRAGWLHERDAMNAAMWEAFTEAQSREPVDVVVGYLSGHNTGPETLLRMRDAGAVVFNYCWDDKLWFCGPELGGRYTGTAGIAAAVDINLTNAPESVDRYTAFGGLAMFWPQAGHPTVHRSYDVEFDYDVSFVGACYGWRRTLIKGLAAYGIEVECFGSGWPNGMLTDEEVVKAYSRSRINLGVGGVGHSHRLTCIKGRDFEIPMSGGLYLTQHNPELSLVFDIGEEICTYGSVESCAAAIRRLLEDPERAASIRRAGQARCHTDHTYEARWSEIFEMAALMRP